MNTNNLLIVIDDSEKIMAIAEEIIACFPEKLVTLRKGQDFSPTDLLPADAFFFGCEKPEPAALSELARVLRGINLKGRACGLFTVKSKAAVDYLRRIAADSDLRVNPKPFIANSPINLADWTTATLYGT